MNDRYQFATRDAELLWSAMVLLRKVMGSGKIRPAQMVSLAKLQHILTVLPRVTEDVTASVSVCCPKHRFGEIETFHWFDYGVEDGVLRITSGGHFYDPMTGGDTFTAMDWSAEPEGPTEFNDFIGTLQMVPDLRSYPEGVENIDLSAEGYTIKVLDDDNPLLDESFDEESTTDGEAEAGSDDAFTDSEVLDEDESFEYWSLMPVDALEKWIASQIDPQQVNAREPIYKLGIEACDICGCDLNRRGFYVDGRRRNDQTMSRMCTECLKGAGVGIGWGNGQLYARQHNGAWRLVAGFEPLPEEG